MLQSEYYRLPEMMKLLNIETSQKLPPLHSGEDQPIVRCRTSGDLTGAITVGYRGTFALDGLSDVKFRKLNHILVCGKVWSTATSSSKISHNTRIYF